jgi:hypothetical protein
MRSGGKVLGTWKERNGFPSERHNRRGRLPSQYIRDQMQLVTEPTAGACHMVS